MQEVDREMVRERERVRSIWGRELRKREREEEWERDGERIFSFIFFLNFFIRGRVRRDESFNYPIRILGRPRFFTSTTGS